jgi:hypothetical protein
VGVFIRCESEPVIRFYVDARTASPVANTPTSISGLPLNRYLIFFL